MTRTITRLVLAAFAATVILPARAAVGSEDPPPERDVAKDKRQDTPQKKSKKKSSDWSSIQLGVLSLDVSLRLESGLRAPTPEIGLTDSTLGWQDRRFGVEGTFKQLSFEFSRDLPTNSDASVDNVSKTPWRDAYVSAAFTKAFNLEGGRFRIPFGREALTPEPQLDFVYRSLAARVLSPGRDNGGMAFGRVLSKHVQYQVGFFAGDGDNAHTAETAGGRDAMAARVLVIPFAARKDSPLQGLQVGVATMVSQLDDRLGLRGRTVLDDGVFFDRVYVNGRRDRIGFDAFWADGPYSASAEYITTSDQRKGMGFDGEDLPDVGSSAWYVAGTWTVTGERKHGRIEPRRDLLRGGFGAVELAGRVEALGFGDVTYPGRTFGFPVAAKLAANSDRVTTVGVNWYLNRYFKVQGNLIFEAIADPQRSPAPANDGQLRSTVMMVQFRF